MKHPLLVLVTVAALAIPIVASAVPMLTTTSCDSTGLYTCLTHIENFQVGSDVYSADFVQGGILDVFGVDPSGDLLEQFSPLAGAYFWGDLDGASEFAGALAALMADEGIDGFLCDNPLVSCEFGSLSRPTTFTYIPVYLQLLYVPPLELASCFAGVNAFGGAASFCYNPGSNNQNWAVISRVPEPSTIALLAFGLVGLGLARRARLRDRRGL